MVHAIRIHAVGGPEVMKWEEVEVGAPGPGQIRLKNSAAGLNYIDTYHRTGLYKLPLPLTWPSKSLPLLPKPIVSVPLPNRMLLSGRPRIAPTVSL